MWQGACATIRREPSADRASEPRRPGSSLGRCAEAGRLPDREHERRGRIHGENRLARCGVPAPHPVACAANAGDTPAPPGCGRSRARSRGGTGRPSRAPALGRGLDVLAQAGVHHGDRRVDDRIAHALLRGHALHQPVHPLDVGGAGKQGPRRRGRTDEALGGGCVFLERDELLERRAERDADLADPIMRPSAIPRRRYGPPP